MKHSIFLLLVAPLLLLGAPFTYADEASDIAHARKVITNPEEYGFEEYGKAKVFLRERGLVPAIRRTFSDRSLEAFAKAFEEKTFRTEGRYPTVAEVDAAVSAEARSRRQAGQLDDIEDDLKNIKRRVDELR